MAELPLLLTAMQLNSTEGVRKALAQDPEAASLPFFDQDVEPPLCTAIRLRCDAQIVSLLLANGADVHATDLQERSPMGMICSTRLEEGLLSRNAEFGKADPNPFPWNAGGWLPPTPLMIPGMDVNLTIKLQDDRKRRSLAIVKLLLAAGADPWAPGALSGTSPSCAELAGAVGNSTLVRLFETWECTNNQAERVAYV
jgi:hypothetical protein